MEKYEYCCKCDEATGRAGAGDDSLYTEHDGPFCEACYPEATSPAAQPPSPPPECKTEAEQTAYAFGWWKALESVRTKQVVQRPWVGLTDEELQEFSDAQLGSYDLCLEVEAKLKEMNT
jgi:hypothetical protein